MIPIQSALDRIEHEIATREAERSTYWQTGKFSLRGLAYVQELVRTLPNTRSEALAQLARHGTPDAEVTADNLSLTAIGWTDRPLAHIHEIQRRELLQQAIARLNDIEDPALLASAILVAQSLPDYRRAYEQRIEPIAAWATRHHEDITEQEHV